MKKVSTFFFMLYVSYAQEPALPFEFLQMTTAVTVMPPILLTHVTAQQFNPPPHIKRKQFINENFESVKEEIAKGEGEYLDTLATLYEVENKILWKKYLQSNFIEIYKETRSENEIFNYIDDITCRKFRASKIYTLEEYNKLMTLTP